MKVCYINGDKNICKEICIPSTREITSAISQTASNIRNNYDEFCSSSDKVNRLYTRTFSMATTIGLVTMNVFAEEAKETMSQKIIRAFDPIIDLIAGVGYPVTNAMLILACLMIITGRKKQGVEMLKWACVGYLGIQFIPFILKILNGIGTELRTLQY